MASRDLDIPEITVVDVQDDINSTPLVNSSFPTSGPPIRHQSSPSDTYDFLPPSTLRLTNRRTSSPTSRTSDGSSSHPPPSPTQSTRSHSPGSTVLRLYNNNLEEHDGLSSSGQLAPPTRGHFPMGRTVAVSSIGTDRDINGSLSLGLSSSIASFLKSDVPVLEGDNAGVRLESAELTRLVEADSDTVPFAFKPLKLMALVDLQSLENFESLGGVEGLLHGPRTNPRRLYVKGASEILAPICTRHEVLGDSTPQVETEPSGELEEDKISRTITSYASQALRTIAVCYRDIPSWPPKGARLLDEGEVNYDDLVTNRTLTSIIGIEDLCRTGVREAVFKCGKAGVRVKICTGDNFLSAKSIAQQCGVTGGIIMEGPHFRTLSQDVMKAIAPLQVLARSCVEDERILVKTLKDPGDVVGVTGDGTNDGPALKTAHVDFLMGIAGTDAAKEASDLILMDDNFPSIVKTILWGRCVDDSVRKFLQFLIPGNFTAVVTMFVWALASSEKEPVLSVVQLLWVNLIMDTTALVLAADPASPAVLDRKLNKRTDPLFTVDMIKQILGQAIYQITMILIFHFLGPQILGFHRTDDSTLQEHHRDIVRTLVFNAFVFAGIFNSFNCRRLDNKLNVFEGVTKNWYFMVITAIEVAVQVLACLVGGSTFDVKRIGAREWIISIALGFVSLPLGALIRLIHNEPCERAFKKLQLLPTYELLPTIRPDAEPGISLKISVAIDHVRDNSTCSRVVSL